MERLYELVKLQQCVIVEKEKEIADMTVSLTQNNNNTINKSMSSIARNVALNIDGSGNTVDASTNNITINIFGREKVDHITNGKVYEILEPFIQSPMSACEITVQVMMQLATIIYCDPDHPENITCYLPQQRSSRRDSRALVRGKTGWEIHPVTMVLPPMMSKSVQLALDKQPWIGFGDTPDEADTVASEEIIQRLRDMDMNPMVGLAKRLAGPCGELRAILVRNREQLSKILDRLPKLDEDD